MSTRSNVANVLPSALAPKIGPGKVRASCRAEVPERILQIVQKIHRLHQIVPKLLRADGELGIGKKVPEVRWVIDRRELNYNPRRLQPETTTCC